MKHNKRTACVCAVVLFFIITGVMAAVFLRQEEQSVYSETTVAYGNLTVGITEEGTVGVGTVTQKLDLSISGLASGTQEFSWQTAFAGGMGMQGGQDSQNAGQEGRTLAVESICVSEGQQIEENDALMILTGDSVDSLRAELSEDVTEAELTLKQYETQRKSTELSAKQTYETNVTYGEAAEIEYEEAVSEAEAVYENAQDELAAVQEELAELGEEAAELEERYTQELDLYEEAAYLVEYIEKEEDPYGYVNALQLRENAQNTKDNTSEDLEAVREEIEDKQQEEALLTLKLSKAQKEQKIAVREAQTAYQTRLLQYENASELYQISTERAEEQCKEAQEEYDSAVARLAEFDAAISDHAIVSGYAGIVSKIAVHPGDNLARGTELVTFNRNEEVTITVSVGEQERKKIAVGDQATVTLAAFEDRVYEGIVEEIADGGTDSSKEAVYEVTVAMTGDVGGIYEGMSGEATFLTKEKKEVLYVSNRAICREGTESYVWQRAEDGSPVKRQVTTGFSDGIHVEIIDGLEEGETVLIESKVSKS